MEQTVSQAKEEVTQTTIKVPTSLWLRFRGVVTTSGSTVSKEVPEALSLWLKNQPKPE